MFDLAEIRLLKEAEGTYWFVITEQSFNLKFVQELLICRLNLGLKLLDVNLDKPKDDIIW